MAEHEDSWNANDKTMRNEMEAQKKHIYRPSTPEAMTALIDLARLSHLVGSGIAEAPNRTATELLERLLTLCKAQRGALLLTRHYPGGLERSALSNRKALRTVALHDMSEEGALALLATYSPEGVDVQTPPAEPCWLICRLPLSVPLAPLTDKSVEPSVTMLSSQTLFPSYALLVLGWTGNDDTCLSAVEKGQIILPLVTDVAGAVLANMLLVGRVHELEVSANRKALREMELLKAELLATVSHELRSPLASIKGYAATLLRHERRISREERHEFLVAINEASDRLALVIDRLLEMSQLETGSITIEPTSVNLAYLVREAITAVEQGLARPGEAGHPDDTVDGQRRYTFTLRLEDRFGRTTGDEPIVQADRHRLREVLDNLLENAIHYSPDGGTIEVLIRPLVTAEQAATERPGPGNDGGKKTGTLPPVPGAQQMVEMCVRDQGIGIPRAHLERIFDHFHRLDTSLTREVNGLGLGLAICKRIVELHDGVIWAESEEGCGSTFHVWLPMDASA